MYFARFSCRKNYVTSFMNVPKVLCYFSLSYLFPNAEKQKKDNSKFNKKKLKSCRIYHLSFKQNILVVQNIYFFFADNLTWLKFVTKICKDGIKLKFILHEFFKLFSCFVFNLNCIFVYGSASIFFIVMFVTYNLYFPILSVYQPGEV